jgi:hypothetical protein
MQTKQTRFLKDSIFHSTSPAALGAVLWLLLTLLAAREAVAQGVVLFNNRIPGGTGVGASLHIWGPSTTNPTLALIGLGSNDSPSGTMPFGSASSMSLIGASGSGSQYGYAMTFAQLIGAVGANQPESALVPVGQTTTFGSGASLGGVVGITDTLSAVPRYATTIPANAPAATFEIVAWDNSSGLYPTWVQASAAWQNGQIYAGHSAPFTVTNIGGSTNITPYLNNGNGSANGMTSFNLFLSYPWPSVATLPATTVTPFSATLNGVANPNGCPDTLGFFQWGTTTAYGNTNLAYGLGEGSGPVPFSWTISLAPGTMCHFRACAYGLAGLDPEAGLACGNDQSFTTPMTSALTINTGRGCWEAASATISYTGDTGSGGGSHSLILLQSADPSAPLSAWTRVATNNSTPGSFSIPPVGTAAAMYYRVKSE